MKKTILYAIVVIVIIAIVLVGFAYFSPVGNMICGPCGCPGAYSCGRLNSTTCDSTCKSDSFASGTCKAGRCQSGETTVGQDGCSYGLLCCCSSTATCSCGSWTSGACGGSCPSGQRQQTRTCSPSGCTPGDGLGTSRCIADSSCVVSPKCSSVGGACLATANCPVPNGVHCNSNPFECTGSTPCCCVSLNTTT